MRILFVAPVVEGTPPIQAGAELARVASGNQMEICDGPVDRSKLEAFLSGSEFDVIHFAQHADRAGLLLSDGLLEVADLVSMLAQQARLRLLVVNACNSIATGVALHNAFHVPVVAHDAPIEDGSAVAFAETLYRALRAAAEIHVAFDRAVKTLQIRFPNDARTPQLINGDMADKQCLQQLRTELDDAFRHFNLRLDGMEAKVDSLNDSRHWRMQLMIVGLLAALFVAQLLTPVLNAWLR